MRLAVTQQLAAAPAGRSALLFSRPSGIRPITRPGALVLAPRNPRSRAPLAPIKRHNRHTACAGASKDDEAEATPGAAATETNGVAVAASAAAAKAGEESGSSSYDEEEVENNPELHPLKEALLRARRRQEEASGIREALEAEAQEVAQLAVGAEGAVAKAKRQLDEAAAELGAAQVVRGKLEAAIAEAKARFSEAQAASRDEDDDPSAAAAAVSTLDLTPAEADAEGDAAAVFGESGPTRGPYPEDVLWDKSQQLEGALARIAEMQAKVAALEAKCGGAEEGYRQADSIAAAAMEAAEEAVRDEMECIAVVKETESALMAAIEDLRFMDDTSERQEEEFDRKSIHKTMDQDEPERAEKVLPSPAEWEEAPKPKPVGLRAVAATAVRHKWALLGVAVVLAAGGYTLHQQGAFAAAAAKAQSASAAAGRLWAVAAELVGRLPWPHIHESEKGLLETIWLLLASVVTVPLICKLPGGSPVLGFLAGGALIGPYALGIIQNVESIRHLAELGVVFLLFNIGLELSFDRLASMGKFVFGMGTAQVVLTMAAVAYIGLAMLGGTLGGPGAIVLGGGLALSTTAVGMQVLADRGETGSKFGRATFSVLLLQDLAVVVLLMLIPLLAPSPDAATGAAGVMRIAKAIGVAGVKAVVTMAAIILGGRTILRPLYKRVADTNNPETFSALTLLVVLGTSLITQLAGLSLALGAFLAGLLLAETEFHLQVESDIAPYKGLLMGLFFMTVGMEISVGMLAAKFRTVLLAMLLLIGGKVAVMGAVGRVFGLTLVQSLRAGLLLAPGGEFAFVLFGEAVSKGIMQTALAKELYLVVALSMALTPFLASMGGKLGKLLERSSMKALQPKEGEASGLSGHVIIAGFGRVGQLIAQMLSERFIPFVALDTSATRVQEGKEQDLPVYFGDAGSPAVLHAVGAERAACAVITLDTPGANYRSVWAMHKHFPSIKTFVRAFDIDNGIMLERAGATAVVPETLEPSLQLASAVLGQLHMPEDEISEVIRTFRKKHLSELQQLAQISGSSLGYGLPVREASDEDEEEPAALNGGDGSPQQPQPSLA